MNQLRPNAFRFLSHGQSGQALVEFTLLSMMLLLLFFGAIDFSRIIHTRLILINLSREGSNLASRGETITNTVASIIISANPLNMNTDGRVIVSSVLNSNGVNIITAQYSAGGIPSSTAISKIGRVGSIATLPSTTTPIPQPSNLLYITEVFYTFIPLTPIGRLMNLALPSPLYDAAYF